MAPAGPYVNCEDVPETYMVGGSGPLSRRLGFRNDRAKFRVKSLPLPVLAEAGDDDELCSSVQGGSPGSCRILWSFNSACELCAMCEAPAGGSATAANSTEVSSEVKANNSEMSLAMKEFDWPTLKEAADSFVDCEISSTASSWLEIGAAWEEDGDIVVLQLPQQPRPQSWAARAKVIAASGLPAMLPAAGFVAPPLQKAFAVKEVKSEDTELKEDDDWDLHSLEDRRLRPHWSGQRLRAHTGPSARVRH